VGDASGNADMMRLGIAFAIENEQEPVPLLQNLARDHSAWRRGKVLEADKTRKRDDVAALKILK